MGNMYNMGKSQKKQYFDKNKLKSNKVIHTSKQVTVLVLKQLKIQT